LAAKDRANRSFWEMRQDLIDFLFAPPRLSAIRVTQ
jgi:hypothetical protein